MLCAFPAEASQRLSEAAASSAVISSPLWKRTPWRRCQVYCVESSLISQLSHSSGTAP